MKNKNKYIALALAVLISTFGCKKQLDKVPHNALEPGEALTTPSDFTNAARGMYQGMIKNPVIEPATTSTATYYGNDWILMWDAMSDNLITSSVGRHTALEFHNWTYAPNNTTDIFNGAYMVIRRANMILDNLNKLPDDNFRKNINGEALAVRAFVHFDLLRTYAKLKYDANNLGVPYMVSTDQDLKPARESVKSNYDKIIADLEAAEPLIAASNGSGRLNKAAVAGFLARVYLYKEDWVKAADAASRSLALNSNVGNITEFPDIWTDATSNGVLFKILFTDKDRVPIGVEYSQASVDGIRSEFVPDFEFYSKYQADDIRKSTYFVTSKFKSALFNHVAKYLGRKTGNKNVLDCKVLRVAEVLLTRAEALYMQGNEPLALADLNALRKQRYSGFIPGTETGTTLADAIALERRLELAFEGDRFFELKRKGQSVVRSNFGDLADGSGASNNEKLLPAGDHRFQLPFPIQEINTNKNFLQNEGY